MFIGSALPSAFPHVDIVGGKVYICGQPAHPVPDQPDRLHTADDLARHGGQVATSPLSARLSLASMSSSRLEQIALNPQPLPPRERMAGSLAHVDDWCGTVPKRLPPPPPQPWSGGLAGLHPLAAASEGQSLLALQIQTAVSDRQRADQTAANVAGRLQDTLGGIAARI